MKKYYVECMQEEGTPFWLCWYTVTNGKKTWRGAGSLYHAQRLADRINRMMKATA